MEDGLLWSALEYAFTPRALVSHLVAHGLVYSLMQQNADARRVLRLAVLQQAVILALWVLVPHTLGSIAAIWICVRLYENALGVKLKIHSNIQLVSDFDFGDAFNELSGSLQFSGAVDDAGRFLISSANLQIAEVGNQSAGIQGNEFKLSNVASVSDKFDSKIEVSLRRIQVDPRRCLFVTTGDSQSSVLIAESPAARDQWLTIMRHMVGDVNEDVAREWLRILLDQHDTQAGGPMELGFEDAISVLNKIKRPVDLKYISEVFKTVAKTTGGKSSRDKLTFDQLVLFFKQTAIPSQVELIFNRLLNKQANEATLRPASFQKFMLTDQKESMSKEQVQDWISNNEPVLRFFNLSPAGLSNYLYGEEHSIFSRTHMRVCQDMKQPLSHYFIATSHNTYLTKDQLKSRSSVDAYINAFKRGCKCVELDCWDGPNNEPIIYHGHTLTSKILFRDVIRAIKDYAFVVSEYPVILSFENHCTMEQQRVMANHLRNILGQRLYTGPPPDNEHRLPSPDELKGYVLVKAKKLKPGEEEPEDDDDFSDDDCSEDVLAKLDAEKVKEEDLVSIGSEDLPDEDEEGVVGEGGEGGAGGSLKKPKQSQDSKLKSLWHSVESIRSRPVKEKVPKIAHELSDLVMYCQAVHFKSFEHSAQHSRCFEMSSFGEAKAIKFAKTECRALLEYNQRQLSRIYPAGARIDSSNLNPTTQWNVGCQLVALNYQTACREMQLNQGLFLNNGGCGYVLKPAFMRQESVTFDPRGPFTSSQTLSVRVISGHQLPYKTDRSVKSERQYQVYVKVAGVDADVQSLKTKPVKNNGYNPTWDEVLVFKVHVPELALVTFSVVTRTVVGQYSLSFNSIQPGYRRVPLTDKHAALLPSAYLLVRVDISAR